MNYENNRKGLEIELRKSLEELDKYREKVIRYDDLEREFRKLEQEKYLLEEKMGYYDKNGEKFTRGEIFKEQEDIRRKLGYNY